MKTEVDQYQLIRNLHTFNLKSCLVLCFLPITLYFSSTKMIRPWGSAYSSPIIPSKPLVMYVNRT